MIALNGTPLTEFNSADPLAKHVRAALARIKTRPYWKLVFHESKVRPIVNQPGEVFSKRTETSAGILQMATSKYIFQGMEHDITYYKSIRKAKDGNEYYPPYVDFKGTLPLDPKKEADLIFYMVCVLPACAPYDFIKDYQNARTGIDLFYKVEDLLNDAIEVNFDQKKIAKIGSLIYDEDFGLKEPILRSLALNYGVADATEIDLELLRAQLRTILLKQSVKGQYDMVKINNFLDDVKNNSRAMLRALVAKAAKDKLIIIAPNSRKAPSWYDTDAEGKARVRLLTFPKDADPQTSLVQHFAKKPDERKAFERYVERGGGGLSDSGKKEHVIEDLAKEKK